MSGNTKPRSVVWSVFAKVDDNNATCTVCNQDIKHCGNTQNLWQHLKRHHTAVHGDLKGKVDRIDKQNAGAASRSSNSTDAENSNSSKRQLSLTNFVTKKMSDLEKKKLDEALLYFIAKDMQPLSVVEDEGFVNYSQALNPSYSLMSRKTVSKMLAEKYESVKKDAMETLKRVQPVNITCDMWTSRATEGYLAITAHGLTEKFEFVSLLLETVHIPQNHTGDNQADEMMNVFDNWGLKGKVFSVVTDNASSAVACVNKLLRKGYARVHLRCSAHTLQLSVHDVTDKNKTIIQVLKRCRDTVSIFHHSCIMTSKLKEAQIQVAAPENKLIQAVSTRWNSSFLMLRRLIEQEKALAIALCAYKPKKNNKAVAVKTDDFVLMKQLVNLLGPFQEATTILSGESYVTSSVVHPLLEHLIKELDKLRKQIQAEANDDHVEGDDDESSSDEHVRTVISVNEDQEVETLDGDEAKEPEQDDRQELHDLLLNAIGTLRSSVMNRFQDVLLDSFHRMASFLDPRFKITYCEVILSTYLNSFYLLRS